MADEKSYTLDPLASDYYTGGVATVSTVSADMGDAISFGDNSGTFTVGTDTLGSPNYDYGSWGNDISVPADGDIKIGDRSLKTFMDTMEKRLAILQPDPAKLEKFEALKKAYEHYKHLESLCELEEEESKK